MKKFFERFIYGITVVSVIFWSLGPAAFPMTADAAVNTVVSDATNGFLRMKASSAFRPALKITIGSADNNKLLNEILLRFNPMNGKNPVFTQSAATSSDLANLSASSSTNSGVTLWRDVGLNGFTGDTDDVNIPIAAPSQTYGAGNRIPLMTASDVTLATDQVYYIALKTNATPVNDNAFSLQVETMTASSTALAINSFQTPPIVIDTQSPSITSFNGTVGTTGAQLRFNEPVQRVGGGNIAFVSAADPFTFVDNSTEASSSTVAGVSHTAGQDLISLTFSRNLTSNDLLDTIAPALNKIMDMAGNVAPTSSVRTMENPIQITTPNLPGGSASSTYTATLAGAGGMGVKAWSAATAQDATTLTNLGLSLHPVTGALNGTIPDGTSGTYNVNLKYRDNVTTATVTTGSAGANAWTITAGNYTPALGDVILYRNITDAPTVTAWGVVTNATNTNQNTFAVNGLNFLAGKSYQMTKLYVASNTSAIGADNTYTQGVNLAAGDIVFYPANANGTGYAWGLVTTAANIAPGAGPGALAINGAVAPTYTVAGRISKFAPFVTSNVTVGAAGANPWTANTGNYTPVYGDVVLYRNITDAPTVVNWGIVNQFPSSTNQNEFKINEQVLGATKQYQISKLAAIQQAGLDGSSIDRAFIGVTVMNVSEGDILFAPADNVTTTSNYAWAFLTGGSGTYQPEGPGATAFTAIKLNGSATGVNWLGIGAVAKFSPTSANATRNLSIGIGAVGGGAPPGISSVAPDFGAVSSTVASIVVTGSNTNFTTASIIEIIKPSNQSIVSTTSTPSNNTIQISNIASTGATNLSFRAVIGSTVASGQYHIRVTSGAQVVFGQNRFNVGNAVAAGLNLITPTSAASNVQIPPLFTFNPSSNASTTSYRITVKTTQDFSGNAVWDYAFPKPADINNSNNSPCTANTCTVPYGPGQFNIITQPIPLTPNTPYYWKIQTYSEAAGSVGNAVFLESTDVRSFTTTASVTDNELPNIFHRPVTVAIKNANLVMYARMFDNIATPTSNPALTGTLLYCTGSACSPTTEVNGVSTGSGYFSFTIGSGAVGVGAGTIIRYRLRASDGTNNRTMDNNGQPFQLTTIEPGAGTISGTVKNSSGTCPDATIRQAVVFIEGSGFSTTSSNDENCSFTLSNLPTSTYSVLAFKDQFGDRKVDAQVGMNTVAIQLTQGIQGGAGGDVTNPQVKFSGPPDNGIAPSADANFRVFVVFDKTMSQNSVTAANALTVNEINPTNGSSTPITSRGTWTYYPTNPNLQNIPPENNIAVWTLSQTACGGPCTFGSNKTIAVKVTGSVTDAAGNPIFANQPDGSHMFSFTTGNTAVFQNFNTSTLAFEGGGTFGSGQFIPPHIEGTTPPPGKFDVPINTKMLINFSKAMADDGSGYLLKDNIKLFEVNESTNAETDVSVSAISAVTLDSAKMVAKVTLLSTYNSSTGLFKANAKYRLKVLGGAKSSDNITLAPPNQSANVMFMSEFRTSSSSDNGAPAVVGSYPDTSATNVPVVLGAINVSFSKDLDASTISASTVKLEIGSTTVNGNVEYRPMDRAIYFMPKAGLTPSTTYTLTVTTGVTGINGTALAANVVRTFTTASSADISAPKVEFVNADDYNIAITFSKPMNAAKATDTLNFPTSILKSANILLKYGDTGFNPATSGTTSTIPSTARFNYDPAMNTLQIEGYRDTAAIASTYIGKEIYVKFTGVKDLSGTSITEDNVKNIGRSLIKNSGDTKGALGPMAVSGDNFARMGNFVPQNLSTATFGFAPPVDVKPFNMMAGKTTIYGIRLPISSQIPSSGSVVLTFPVGFDVSGAQQDINSPMRTDLNGPGTGTPTFKCAVASNGVGGRSCAGTANADDTGLAQGGLADDGVIVNTNLRTVTIFINGATSATDFLTIDVSGIKNSTVPKDFNTSGYTIDIKTKSADGTTVLESLTSMPFFVQAGGSYTLSGTVTATGNNQAGTMKVYLNSPMTGPVDATTVNFDDTVSGAADGPTMATYSFTNLSAGEYFLFTDQTVSVGVAEFVGKAMPERILVGGNTVYNFTLANATAGTTVTVSIKGPVNTPIDVFANSPTGFKVKQVTLNGDANDYEAVTLKLGDGRWKIGVGPQMPKGPMAGQPPAPNYVPPQPIDVTVSGVTVLEQSDTANDGTVKVTLTSTDMSIKGVVKDGNSKVMANAEVYAYSPQGGMGTHASADMAGGFTLNVTAGSYIVGAFIPGMPSSKEVPVIVKGDGTLLIDGATTAITANAAATAFILKLAKPDYTISGKVTDGTNVIQGASVYARCDGSVSGNACMGPGSHANANTDSSGNYTLYVKPGTWKVGSFVPQYGQLAEQTVVVSTSNATNIDFSPSLTGTFKSVAGNVQKGGVNVQGAFIRIMGNGTSNETITDSSGNYSFNVPTCATACYTLKGFIPGVGDLPPKTPFSVTDNITAGAATNFSIGASRTITFTLSAAVTEKTFIDIFSSTGQGNHAEIQANALSATMQLPDGAYGVRVFIPGIPIGLANIAGTNGDTVYSNTDGTVTVDGNEGLTVTIPTATLRTVTGTVTDGTMALANAWVEIMNKNSGVHFGSQSAADGSFTLKVSDNSEAYSVNVMKPGYFREPTSLTVNGANPAVQTLILPTASKVISGQVKIGSVGAANAFVRAERQGGGFSGTQADASGNYTLPVNAGTWRVFGVAEGYAESELSNRVDMSTATSSVNNTITLTTQVSLNAPKTKPITPASGGTLEDTTAGVKLTIPANALGSGTSAGNVQARETNNVRPTSTAVPIGNKAKEIKATDSSGNPITTLNDSVTVEMIYTKAELAATRSSSDTSIDTKAEADKLKMAYWDETNANWTALGSTVTYLDASGSATTTVDANLANIASVKVTAPTSHLSLYAPIVPVDPTITAIPTGVSVGSATASTLSISWAAVVGATSYDIYRSTSQGGTYTRIGSEPTVSSGSTTSYTDTDLSANTTYYYKMTSISGAGESGVSSIVSGITSAATAINTNAGAVAIVNTTNTATQQQATDAAKKAADEATAKANAAKNAEAAKVKSLNQMESSMEGMQVTAQKSGEEKLLPKQIITEKVIKTLVEVKTTLKEGAKGTAVKTVQEILKAEGLLAKPSAKMDTSTLNAIKKFQEKYGIAKKGQVGYGVLGPKTRAKMNAIVKEQKNIVEKAAKEALEASKTMQGVMAKQEAIKPIPAPLAAEVAQVLVKLQKPLGIGAKGTAVKTVQEILKAEGLLAKPSAKMDTSTLNAIKKFQEKYGIAKKGQVGYGVLGPKTRAMMNAMLGK
jgi:hypothetical protein